MAGQYQRLAQTIDDAEEGLEQHTQTSIGSSLDDSLPPTTPSKAARRIGKINLSSLDSNFKRWTETISHKVKRKRRIQSNPEDKKEIVFSVFQPITIEPWTEQPIKTLDHSPPMTNADFEALVDSVRLAIADGIHPKMISKGSSGSYFARAKDEGRIRTVGVFKPKDEEPYGKMNPKLIKWLHRNFFWWIGFGRACLIPNLSYISEAAACLLDQRLGLHIVPHTGLATLSSPSFFYDWIDRSGYKQGKPLPGKIGSMQRFMDGYRDASDFFREHPIADAYDYESHRTGTAIRRCTSALGLMCGRAGDLDDFDEPQDEQSKFYGSSQETVPGGGFNWTTAMLADFQGELERLIILDYLMRNTDRGLDNFMIKHCEAAHDKDIIDVAPSRSMGPQLPLHFGNGTPAATPPMRQAAFGADGTPRLVSTTGNTFAAHPHMHIAAIDNSLSFPHQHPKGWRSYTYGWLYLPVSVIGRPFGERTRRQVLPLLTSPTWWAETRHQLRKLFAVDPDFNEKLFNRQMAVMKGQGWNIVQCLQHTDEGPLELTRRTKVLVWDDEVQVPEGATDDELMFAIAAPPDMASSTARPAAPVRSSSFASVPVGRRGSVGSIGFPPRLQRNSTDLPLHSRPVPFAGKFDRSSSSYPGISGVSVLEHLERLDAVERDLQRLGMESPNAARVHGLSIDDDELRPVGETRSNPNSPTSTRSYSTSPTNLIPTSKGKQPLRSPHGRRASVGPRNLPTIEDEDPFLDMEERASSDHRRVVSEGDHLRAGSRSLDLGSSDTRPHVRTVIRERLEAVKAKEPWLSWW